MGFACAPQPSVIHTYGVREATACSVQCFTQMCRSTSYSAFHNRDGQDVLIYGCISILILMYDLNHLVFLYWEQLG
jgi:hypothetical protein